MRAENSTGFKGVSLTDRGKPFKATLMRGGRRSTWAPSCRRRRRRSPSAFLGPEGVAAALAVAAPEPAPMTAAQAHARRRRRGWRWCAPKLDGLQGRAPRAQARASRFGQPDAELAQQQSGQLRDGGGGGARRRALSRAEGVAGLAAAAPAAAQAHAAAAVEGLALVRADNPTGFKGVSRNNAGGKPFVRRCGMASAPSTSAPSRRRRRRRSPSPASSGRRASRHRSRRSPRR